MGENCLVPEVTEAERAGLGDGQDGWRMTRNRSCNSKTTSPTSSTLSFPTAGSGVYRIFTMIARQGRGGV